MRRCGRWSNALRLSPRPVFTRSCLEEARTLSQYQPVQHISLLLALGTYDDLDVARLGKVWKFILRPE